MTWVEFSLTYFGGFLTGAMTSAAGKYLADKFTDQRHRQEARVAADQRFEKVHRAMPALIAQIRADLAHEEYEHVREFAVVPTPTIPYNHPHALFCYYEDQHPDLSGKVVLLETAGYVEHPHASNDRLFRMSNEFVEQVRRSREGR